MGTRLTSTEAERLGLFSAAENRKLGGRAARQAGDAFERGLEAQHSFYARAGKALILRMHVPTQPVGVKPYAAAYIQKHLGANPNTLRRITGPAPIDYFGPVQHHWLEHSGPLMVYMEAKSNAEPAKWLRVLKPEQSGHGIRAEQAALFIDAAEVYDIYPVLVWKNGDNVLLIGGNSLLKGLRQKSVLASECRRTRAGSLDWIEGMKGLDPVVHEGGR